MPNDIQQVSLGDGGPSEVTIAHIRFDLIDQNPFRDLINNPLRQEQIDRLIASLRSTGFWDNVLVRPHPTVRGRYQLAYGHGRIAAAQEAGLTSAAFSVKQLSDDQMIRIMADENVSQFGKDSFKTYKEATVAAAIFIMRAVITDPTAAAKFGRSDPQHHGKLAAEITGGDCPGRRTIADFYNGTLDPHNIELALAAFRDTGELAAWHNANNRHLKRAVPVPQTLDPEALRRFDKPHHVRTFVDAIKQSHTPIEEQASVADRIIDKLGPEPAKAKSGRDKHQSQKEPGERFIAANIRGEVMQAAVERTRGVRRKEELERVKQMSSLEKALVDFDSGLTRTISGYRNLDRTVDAMGKLTDSDMTVLARQHLEHAAKSLGELEQFLKSSTLRKVFRLIGGK